MSPKPATLALLFGALSCTANGPPGSERMGTFAMHAVPLVRDCTLPDVPGTELTFDATFSRNPSTNEAFVTLAQFSRDAGWNGQTIESTLAAARTFGGDCAACPMALSETIRVDLLSLSQNEAAQDRCPDGPAPAVDEDAGIRAPGPDLFGYDAVRACGTLLDATLVVGPLPDGGACPGTCSHCTVQYRLTGERK